MSAGAIIVLFVLAAGPGAVAQCVGTPRLGTPRTSYDWAIIAAGGLLTGARVADAKQ